MDASAELAMCLAGNCKNGISSYELHRCLGQGTTASKQSRVVFLATVVAVIFFVSSENDSSGATSTIPDQSGAAERIRCWCQFLGGWPVGLRQSLGRLLQDDREKRMQERHGLASRPPDGTERGTSVRR